MPLKKYLLPKPHWVQQVNFYFACGLASVPGSYSWHIVTAADFAIFWFQRNGNVSSPPQNCLEPCGGSWFLVRMVLKQDGEDFKGPRAHRKFPAPPLSQILSAQSRENPQAAYLGWELALSSQGRFLSWNVNHIPSSSIPTVALENPPSD